MGQQQNSSSSNSNQLLSSPDWAICSSKHDLNYGDIKIYQNQNDHSKIASSLKVFQSEKDYNQFLKKIQELRQLNELSGMVKILEISEQREDHLCSQFYKISIIQEYFDKTLQDELVNRTSIFSRNDIIIFLQQMVHILLELENKSLMHSDLRPSQILISQTGEYKLKMQENDQYRKLLINFDANNCYLSPEQFISLCNQQLRFKQDTKCDIYTLGLVALQMGTIKRIQTIYNLDHGIVDQIKVDQMTNEFEENQGKELAMLVRRMLEFKCEMRPELIQIYENLMLSQDKFYFASQSPIKENNRYNEQIQRKPSPPPQTSQLNNIAPPNIVINQKQSNESQKKRNYNVNIWQDSDTKVFVPINPGENFMNEKLDLSSFSITKQDKQSQNHSEIKDVKKEKLQDISNKKSTPKSTNRKPLKSNEKKVINQKPLTTANKVRAPNVKRALSPTFPKTRALSKKPR